MSTNKSDKQRRFVDALEHNPSFAQKVKNKIDVPTTGNMASTIHDTLKKFAPAPVSQEVSMSPGPKFKKLRASLKY